MLTGAGVSAESGVPTFRGPGGLWRSYRPEDLASPEAFASDPVLVWRWYSWRRDLVSRCVPNAAHEAIAAWSRRTSTPVITQNVDGLHSLALGRPGDPDVDPIELHGSLFGVRCTACRDEKEDRTLELVPDGADRNPESLPRCECGGLLRPAVVWFGEALDEAKLARCHEIVAGCSVCLVVGTSSLVYPAAGLPKVAQATGATIIEVNVTETPLTPISDKSLRGPASSVIPALLDDGNTSKGQGS